jgi:hypothetical protein
MSDKPAALLLAGGHRDVVRVLQAGPCAVVLVTVGPDLFAVEALGLDATREVQLALVEKLLGPTGSDGSVTAVVVSPDDDDEIRAFGAEGRRPLLDTEQAAVRRLGIVPSPAVVRVVVTSASYDDVESAANVARATVTVAPVGAGLLAVEVERPEGTAPDEQRCGEFALALAARRRPTLELWRDVDVQGAFVWTRRELEGLVAWGRPDEVVVPTSMTADERSGIESLEGPQAATVASAASVLLSSPVDEVALRALLRRRDLSPDDVSSALVEVLRLPPVVGSVLTSATAVAQLPGAQRIEGKGLKAELGRIWQEPLSDDAPAWLRIQDTRPLWYRLVSAVAAFALARWAFLLWTADDAGTGRQVLAVVTGLVALATAEVAVGRAKHRHGRSES